MRVNSKNNLMRPQTIDYIFSLDELDLGQVKVHHQLQQIQSRQVISIIGEQCWRQNVFKLVMYHTQFLVMIGPLANVIVNGIVQIQLFMILLQVQIPIMWWQMTIMYISVYSIIKMLHLLSNPLVLQQVL